MSGSAIQVALDDYRRMIEAHGESTKHLSDALTELEDMRKVARGVVDGEKLEGLFVYTLMRRLASKDGGTA